MGVFKGSDLYIRDGLAGIRYRSNEICKHCGEIRIAHSGFEEDCPRRPSAGLHSTSRILRFDIGKYEGLWFNYYWCRGVEFI